MTAKDRPSRALAVLAAMAVGTLIVAAAVSPTLNAVVIGVGLGLGAVIGAVGVAAYELTGRKAPTSLPTALAGALCCFAMARWWLVDDPEGEMLVATLGMVIGGAFLGLLCGFATLLVLRADVPDSADR
ncbi:hypothetical protein [Nocardioides speluncae]|uniref:hypothetical protein n=1 Tax=Nocardioides speluncae TaxID=2670337 RepID=UPI0012B1658C|nr:hypothetical protein [Nocardioides speluncae]